MKTPVFSALAGLLIAVAAPAAAEDEVDLSQYYGFQNLELFKLELRSGNLRAGDLNADGLTDLVIVDNSHSRIDVLQQRQDKTRPLESQTDAVNAVPNSRFFEHVKIPVDKEITSLALGDFNGDGRTDVAYFGVPDRLVVRFQPEDGEWTERRDVRIPDVPQTMWTLAAGDLNSDQRDDLVVLGTDETTVLYQQADGTLEAPVKLMNTSSQLGLAQIADLDGDGRSDLCYVAGEGQDRSVCARLQRPDGRLGPELRFEVGEPRAITLADIDDRPGQEILTIDARTNRAVILQLQPPEASEGEPASRLIQYGFGQKGSGRDRDVAIGDVDGDGLTDLVATDPDAAQMIVFRQHKEQGLDLGTAYPGFVGSS
ncbi:MAG: FG-GAP repeat domain-containing protein, partial [Planctomycetaceae bacterium]